MDTSFTHALAEEVITLQAQFPDLSERLARAQTLIADGRLFMEDSGTEAMVTSKDGTQY